MTALRWLATLAICAAAIAGIAYGVVMPQRCNRIEGEVQRTTDRIAHGTDPSQIVPYARQNLALLEPCMRCAPDVNRAMVLGINLRFLGRVQDAINVYDEALRRDPRPELYLNLGEAQLEAGQNEEGMKTLITACKHNPDLVDEVPALHEDLYREVETYYKDLLAKQQRRGSR